MQTFTMLPSYDFRPYDDVQLISKFFLVQKIYNVTQTLCGFLMVVLHANIPRSCMVYLFIFSTIMMKNRDQFSIGLYEKNFLLSS